MKKLSVIITAYSHHDITVKHVEQCMLSTRVPDEIIVVNDHGTPELRDMLKAIDKKCDLHYAYITDDILWNYTGARNLGFFISTGDYIMVEDNDQIPYNDFYEQAIAKFKAEPNIGRLCAWSRTKISKEDFLAHPREEWVNLGKHIYHRDTNMIRRDVMIKLKGCDERFAGAYAWACTDWRRRLDRAGVEFGNVGKFYTLIDGSTEENEETGLIRRKSYRNYELARERDGHIQSGMPRVACPICKKRLPQTLPMGILNYSYEYEKL